MDIIEMLDGVIPSETLLTYNKVESFLAGEGYDNHILYTNELMGRENYVSQDYVDELDTLYQSTLEVILVRYGVVLDYENYDELPVARLLSLTESVQNVANRPSEEFQNLDLEGLDDCQCLATVIALVSEFDELLLDGIFKYVDPRLTAHYRDKDVPVARVSGARSGHEFIENLRQYSKAGNSVELARAIATGDVLLPINLDEVGNTVHKMMDYSIAIAASQEWVGICLLAEPSLEEAIVKAETLVRTNFLTNATGDVLKTLHEMGETNAAVRLL